MAVQIEKKEGTILVNGQPVIQDMDGTWIDLKNSLNDIEKKYFKEYLDLLEHTSAKEVKATFIG